MAATDYEYIQKGDRKGSQLISGGSTISPLGLHLNYQSVKRELTDNNTARQA
jgi:hypothetical protein